MHGRNRQPGKRATVRFQAFHDPDSVTTDAHDHPNDAGKAGCSIRINKLIKYAVGVAILESEQRLIPLRTGLHIIHCNDWFCTHHYRFARPLLPD